MEIQTTAFIGGVIIDKYGKRGREKRFGMPTLSFPLQIIDAPKNTKSFAIIFDDAEAEEICGFMWDHWLIANLHRNKLEENESETAYDFIQGQNLWKENCYGGPCPLDKPHKYRLAVYALSSDLNLVGNFSRKDLEKQMKGKILDSAEIYGVYSNLNY